MWREQGWQTEKLKGDAVPRHAQAIPPGSSEVRRQGILPWYLTWMSHQSGLPWERHTLGELTFFSKVELEKGSSKVTFLSFLEAGSMWLEGKFAGRPNVPLQVAEFRENETTQS